MTNDERKVKSHGRMKHAVTSLAIVALGLSGSAGGTSCFLDSIISGQDDPAEFVDSISDIVFVGMAIEKWVEQYSNVDGTEYIRSESTVFKVGTVLKGNINVDDELLVIGTLLDCSCVKGFVLGQRYRVVASIRSSHGKDSYIVQYCKYISELDRQ